MIKPISNLRGAVMVWVVSYIFFLFTLANNFSASHDSIHYLLGIVSGEHLFHQHHLLYHFYANTWLTLFSGIFPSIPNYYLIESFTAVWGSANLAVCFLFFRNRFNLTILSSVIGVALIAFSYGTWFYSVNIEVYAPPIFFILCCLYIISRNESARSDVWKLAILHSLAILFHQVNILFSVVVFYWIWNNRKKFAASRAFFQYAIIGTLLTGGVYIFCGVFYEQKTSVDEFAQWILGYTSGHSYWQPLSAKTPVNAVAGFSRAFIGGHFIFQHPYMQEALVNSFRSHGLRDEIFLSQNISRSTTYLLIALSGIVGLSLLVMATRFGMAFKKMRLHFHVIRPLLVCIVVYSIFFLFWMPEILEFWILQMILVWLLLVGMLPAYRFPLKLQPRTALLMLCVSLFIVNYAGSMRWLQKKERDWYYVEVKKLDASLGKDDVVILEDEWILKDYVRWFSKAKVIATDEPDYNINAVRKVVSDAVQQNHKVIFYRKSPAGGSWELIRSY